MLFGQNTKKTLEQKILELLHKGGTTGPILLESLRKTTPSLPKESFYRILRNLVSQEVVTKYQKIYEINQHWLQRIQKFSQDRMNILTEEDNILSFKEGDKVTYSFKNPNLMGIYWAHTYDIIFEKHDPKIPILVFHPHEWLIYTRTSSEALFLSRFQDSKKLAYFSIGGATILDKTFKKEWADKFRQISTGIHYGFKNTEYINVLGDFIFKITVSKKFAASIDDFFKRNSVVDDENVAELIRICNRPDRTRMVFTRSKKVSTQLHKKFEKYFFKPRI